MWLLKKWYHTGWSHSCSHFGSTGWQAQGSVPWQPVQLPLTAPFRYPCSSAWPGSALSYMTDIASHHLFLSCLMALAWSQIPVKIHISEDWQSCEKMIKTPPLDICLCQEKTLHNHSSFPRTFQHFVTEFREASLRSSLLKPSPLWFWLPPLCPLQLGQIVLVVVEASCRLFLFYSLLLPPLCND